MRMNCACGCGQGLTGKQRMFWSDACRKRYHRKADGEGVRERAENGPTVYWQVEIGQFSDKVLSANGGHKLHLVQCLQADLDYQEVWVKRLLNAPGGCDRDQLEMHQFACEALGALIGDLVAWEPGP